MKKRVFKAKPGQVDYTDIRWAPVINCVVQYRSKILILHRSSELRLYPGYWNGVSGFLDDKKSLKEKVIEELREEVGIPKAKIKKIRLGEIFHDDDPKLKKTWIVHPVLVEVTTDKIKLDWESQDFKWATLSEAKKLKLMPGFIKVMRRLAVL